MAEDYGKLRVTAVFRNGRCRYDPISKSRLVDACLEPGVSVAQLALEHGVNANLLRRWVKQRKAQAQAQGAVSRGSAYASPFIPVSIDPQKRQGFREDRKLHAPELPMQCSVVGRRSCGDVGREFGSPARLEARLPNGVTLSASFGDAATLTTLIGALSDVQTGH
jgi:transposase